MHCPGVTIETLIPDFQGKEDQLDRIIAVAPEILYNIETVKRLTREVRVQARYERSMEVLAYLKEGRIAKTKSGITPDWAKQKRKSMKPLMIFAQRALIFLPLGSICSQAGSICR
jgi:lipoic acid synthetase